MDLFVEIKITRWGGNPQWKFSGKFPFIVRRTFDTLYHRTYTVADQKQRVRFNDGGIITEDGQFSLLGYDFLPRVIGRQEMRADVDGNQQPL